VPVYEELLKDIPGIDPRYSQLDRLKRRLDALKIN